MDFENCTSHGLSNMKPVVALVCLLGLLGSVRACPTCFVEPPCDSTGGFCQKQPNPVVFSIRPIYQPSQGFLTPIVRPSVPRLPYLQLLPVITPIRSVNRPNNPFAPVIRPNYQPIVSPLAPRIRPCFGC